MNSKQTTRGPWLPAILACSAVAGGYQGAAADDWKGMKTDGLVALSQTGGESPLALAGWRLAGAITDRPSPKGPQGLFGPVERMYENLAPESLFFSDAQPHRAGDDVSFMPDAGCLAPVRVTGVEFGMFVNAGPGGDTNFDTHVLFYDTLNPGAKPVNSGFLGGIILEMRNIWGHQAYTTGPIDIRPVLPQGICIEDGSFFVDIRFYEPGSTTQLSPRATPLFSGIDPHIGSSANIYWRDNDGNDLYDPFDARYFGGGPALANFYLALDGIMDGIACPADFNRDGALNSQDFFDFIAAFLTGDATGDFNGDSLVNSQDFFDYLGVFLAGCE